MNNDKNQENFSAGNLPQNQAELDINSIITPEMIENLKYLKTIADKDFQIRRPIQLLFLTLLLMHLYVQQYQYHKHHR